VSTAHRSLPAYFLAVMLASYDPSFHALVLGLASLAILALGTKRKRASSG